MIFPSRSVLGGTLLAASVLAAAAQSPVERGRYLVTVMGCGGCHTTGALAGGHPVPGQEFAGATIGWAIPGFGVVTPSNLTSDTETGLGSWSAGDIVRLLRTGTRPDGREIVGPMDWRAYAHLTDEDVDAVAAYLKSLPPAHHAVPGPTPLAEVKGRYFTIAGTPAGGGPPP